MRSKMAASAVKSCNIHRVSLPLKQIFQILLEQIYKNQLLERNWGKFALDAAETEKKYV